MNIVVNGKSMTQQEYAAWSRGRVQRLRDAGATLEDALREQQCPSIETDSTMLARCYSAEPEWRRRQIAMAARRAGKCEEQAYDPTLAHKVLDPNAMFETNGQREARIADAKRPPIRDESKPYYRLHPRLVQEEIQRRAAVDPGVLRRDRRELVEEIVERHGSKG
jgi:hypothetical protein